MIESWSDVIIGMMLGICVAGIAITLFWMIRMNFNFMVWRKVRNHEDEFHAEELKERENPEVIV